MEIRELNDRIFPISTISLSKFVLKNVAYQLLLPFKIKLNIKIQKEIQRCKERIDEINNIYKDVRSGKNHAR